MVVVSAAVMMAFQLTKEEIYCPLETRNTFPNKSFNRLWL
jgi:hypothetical protein